MTKNNEHLYKKYNLFSLFFRLATNEESERERQTERKRESRRGYKCIRGIDWRSLLLNRYLGSVQTSEHGCFHRHIYSRLTTSGQATGVFFPPGDNGTLGFQAFVLCFHSHICRSSHFLFQWVTTTWLTDQSTRHSFPISTSLCHLYPLSFYPLRCRSF